MVRARFLSVIEKMNGAPGQNEGSREPAAPPWLRRAGCVDERSMVAGSLRDLGAPPGASGGWLGVVVTGWVRDVRPYFEGCRVFVAALRYGAGTKGKIGRA